MVVYLIRNLRTRRVKIGKTNDLQTRLSKLQAGNDEKLHVELQCPGDRAYVNELHQRFANKRHTEDWFNLSKTDMHLMRQEFQKRSELQSKRDNDRVALIFLVLMLIVSNIGFIYSVLGILK